MGKQKSVILPGTVVNNQTILKEVFGHFKTEKPMRTFEIQCNTCGKKTTCTIYFARKVKCSVCRQKNMLSKLLADPRITMIVSDAAKAASEWTIYTKCPDCNYTRILPYSQALDMLKTKRRVPGCNCPINPPSTNKYHQGKSYSQVAKELGLCKETVRLRTVRQYSPPKFKVEELGTLKTWVATQFPQNIDVKPSRKLNTSKEIRLNVWTNPSFQKEYEELIKHG